MQQLIYELRAKLISHPVYRLISSQEALRIFMESHVVAVLDFMSLVKSLQNSICGYSLPWVPAKNVYAVRLINEIVLSEESDAVGATYQSHFQLYIDAMKEIGCDISPTLQFLANIRSFSGTNRLDDAAIDHYLSGTYMNSGAAEFFRHTMTMLRKPAAVQAAVFFYARENIIPSMFGEMVVTLAKNGLKCNVLLNYLERHIKLDAELHGPMAEKLLLELYDGDAAIQCEAESDAISAINMRIRLWDDIAERITGMSYPAAG